VAHTSTHATFADTARPEWRSRRASTTTAPIEVSICRKEIGAALDLEPPGLDLGEGGQKRQEEPETGLARDAHEETENEEDAAEDLDPRQGRGHGPTSARGKTA
jgi:hypothetical protein